MEKWWTVVVIKGPCTHLEYVGDDERYAVRGFETAEPPDTWTPHRVELREHTSEEEGHKVIRFKDVT